MNDNHETIEADATSIIKYVTTFVNNNPVLFVSLFTTFASSLTTIFINKIVKIVEFIFSWFYSLTTGCARAVSFTFKKRFRLNYNCVVIDAINVKKGSLWNPDCPDVTVFNNAKPLIWYISKNCEINVEQMYDIKSNVVNENNDNKKKEPNTSSTNNQLLSRENTNIFVPLEIRADYMQNIVPQAKNFNKQEGNDYYPTVDKETEKIHNATIGFLSLSKYNIKVTNDIYLDVKQDYQNTQFILKSRKPTSFIKDFINSINDEYYKFLINNKGFKSKVFVYKGLKDGKPEYSEYEMDKSQTFENLFTNNKKEIIKLIEIFHKIDFHKTRGLKRKISAMFFGVPGTGKTASCIAMANLLDRCIILVPISRIKTNLEMEKILYSKEVNQYIIPNENKIFLFDELDSVRNVADWKKITVDKPKSENLKSSADGSHIAALDIEKPEKNVNENNILIVTGKDGNPQVPKFEPEDAFNIGHFGTIIDGPMDQDGMIIIATANNLSIFDDSLCRDGRFSKFEFKYMGKEEIAEMINKYFIDELTSQQLETIRNDQLLTNQVLKNLCLQCLHKSMSIDEVINFINDFKQ